MNIAGTATIVDTMSQTATISTYPLCTPAIRRHRYDGHGDDAAATTLRTYPIARNLDRLSSALRGPA